METRFSTQHLVIGSGAGGAVTAAYLAEAGESVLVIEEGMAVERGEVAQFSIEQMRRQYRNSGTTAMFGNYLLNYAEGCCLGGSTEVNSGLYHLPGKGVLKGWREHFGTLELTEESVRTIAGDIEKTLGIAAPGGETTDGASARLRDGATALGWDCQEVPRWAHTEPDGRTVWHGMSTTFVPRAQRAGATFVTGVRAERITVPNRHATGVIASDAGGERFVIEAERVWVACGAIGTAALLRRSRLLSGRGGLSAHPTVKAVARFPDGLGPANDVPTHQVKEFAPEITIGGSARSASQVALALADEWPSGAEYLEDPERVGLYYASVAPQGNTGSVATVPGVSDPVPFLWITRRDRALLASGLRRTCLLLLAAGAEEVRTGVPGVGTLSSDGDLEKIPRILPLGANLMTVHTFSTVPGGENEELCPADSFGRLKATEGVHVADASLIPSAPGMNPQGTVMALAARNAQHFLATR